MLLYSEPYTIQSPIVQRLKVHSANLANSLDYDIVKIIEIGKNNSYAKIKREYSSVSSVYHKNFKENRIFLKNNPDYILNLMIQMKQMIAYSKDSGEYKHFTLIKDIERELYLPVFLNNSKDEEVIGCIYLGSFTPKYINSIEEIINEKAYSELNEIINLYHILYMKTASTENMLSMLHVVSEITKVREPYMTNHPYRVAQWSRIIGEKMLLDKKLIKKLSISATIHDIGKLYIDRDILNKTTPLTEKEYEILKKHAVYSSTIAKDLFTFSENLSDIPRIIRHHHERFDGKGYPDGLKGKDIPLESRILCVADSVDAMLSPRAYKDPKTLEQTVKELFNQRSKQFDPEIVDIMVQLLLKTKVTQENIISDLITWGTLTIETNENSYIVEGTIEEHNVGYIFKSHNFNFLKDIEKPKINKASLFIEKRRNIIEFDLNIEIIGTDIVYISKLMLNPLSDSYSMLWNMAGSINIDNETRDIQIFKVGGSSLSFYTLDYKIQNHLRTKILKVNIVFDEGEELSVTGKIIKGFSFSKKNYYEFKYINTPDNIKDKIFRRLFRRQIDLIKLA